MSAKPVLVVLALLAMAVWPATAPGDAPVALAAATCADYPNQAAAQRAADTRRRRRRHLLRYLLPLSPRR